MEVIRDRDGNVVSRSRNLRGIVRAFGQYLVKTIVADPIGDGEGKLLVVFDNGYNFESNWADFDVLVDFLHNRRTLKGFIAKINGQDVIIGKRS